MKELGHIPGEIVIVNFDGMGPTWTQLVKVGLKNYPQATHGIIAGADLLPMHDKLDKFDKSKLDMRCSKLVASVWTERNRVETRTALIYRNQPGTRLPLRSAPDLLTHDDDDQGGGGDGSGCGDHLARCHQCSRPLLALRSLRGKQTRAAAVAALRLAEQDAAERPRAASVLLRLAQARLAVFERQRVRTGSGSGGAPDLTLLLSSREAFLRHAGMFAAPAALDAASDAELDGLCDSLLQLARIEERFLNDVKVRVLARFTILHTRVCT
jgi:hypothetical protein